MTDHKDSTESHLARLPSDRDRPGAPLGLTSNYLQQNKRQSVPDISDAVSKVSLQPASGPLQFAWSEHGSATVMHAVFEMQHVEKVEVSQDLGTYVEMRLTWRQITPTEQASLEATDLGSLSGALVMKLSDQVTVDFQSGERYPHSEPAIEFAVDSSGRFVRVLNLELLAQQSLDTIGASAPRPPQSLAERMRSNPLSPRGSATEDGSSQSRVEQIEFLKQLIDETARTRWLGWAELWTQLPRDHTQLLAQEMMLSSGPVEVFGASLLPLSVLTTHSPEPLKNNYVSALQSALPTGMEAQVDVRHAEHRQQFECAIEEATLRPHILTTFEHKVLVCEARVIPLKPAESDAEAASPAAPAAESEPSELPPSLFFQKRFTKTVFCWDDVPEMVEMRADIWANEYVQFHEFCAAVYAEDLRDHAEQDELEPEPAGAGDTASQQADAAAASN